MTNAGSKGGATGTMTVRRAGGKMSRQEIDNFARNTSRVLGEMAQMTGYAVRTAKNPQAKSEKIQKIISDAHAKIKKEVEGNEGKGNTGDRPEGVSTP